MEVLANISLEWFRILTWGFAVLFGVLAFFSLAHKKYWEVIAASATGLLTASFVFLLSNLAVAFYILANITNPRWSVGKDPLMSPTEIQSPLGFVDELVGMLNDVQQNVSGAVNTVGHMQNALFVAAEFLWMATLAIGAVFAFAICTFVAAWWAKRRNEKQRAKALANLQVETKAIQANLADIRAQSNLGAFQKPVQ